MTAIEEACLLSCESWIDSFPKEIPNHKFSREHKKAIAKILYTNNEKYKVTFSKRNVKILLIAAILLTLATTVYAIPKSREFIVDKYSNHSEYNIVDTDNIKDVKSLTVKYVPEGFEVTEKHTASGFYILKYENGEKSFTIDKTSLDFTINFDTEKYDSSEEIKINDIDAVYYRPDDDMHGVIFNNGEYIYSVSGHISKDEIIKIAQNIE